MTAVQLRVVPDNPLEALAMAANAVPRPLVDTLVAAGLARTVMVAGKIGLFEALGRQTRTTAQLAAACGTDPGATEHLLVALSSCGYVRACSESRGHGDRLGGPWALTPMARKWLMPDARHSLHDHVALMELVWRWLEHYEPFVRTGVALDVHRDMDAAGWSLYQRGMRSIASLGLDEFVLRTRVPTGATSVLDIGGSHGSYAGALCRRYPRISAVVLDLPEATEHAAPLVRELGLGNRLQQRAGDARTADLGRDAFDVILVSNLVHHFDAATNRDLVGRAAIALREGGVLVVQEPMRSRTGDQIGGLASLYFAALSASATWTTAEIARWQRDAGLLPDRPRRFATVPGFSQQSARKRR